MLKNFLRKQFAHFKAIKIESLRLGLMWIFAFISITLLSYFDDFIGLFISKEIVIHILFAPIGASAVILFTVPQSPISQAKNVILGHSLCAFVGVLTLYIFGNSNHFAAGFSVASAIIVMLLTNTLHPPGGATALFAVIASEATLELGFYYVLFPSASGAICIFILTKFFNKLINIFVHYFDEEENNIQKQ